MTAAARGLTLAAALSDADASVTLIRRSARRYCLAGATAALVLVLGMGGFALTVPLSSAVIAPGRLMVESTVKKIQHQDGGIVAEIPVQDGSRVKAGDLLVRLDDTAAKANLGIVNAQIDELETRLARLEAERDDTPDLELKAGTDADRIAPILAGERRLLTARRSALEGQKVQLRERLTQLGETTTGDAAQEAGRRSELAVVTDELEAVEQLYRSNLVTVTRVHELRRDKARLEGDIGALVAQAAETRSKIAETRSQLLGLDQEHLSDVMKDLRDTQSALAPLYERRIAAEDQLRRTRIPAPIDGTVHELSVHTIGGVVTPGETVMMVVPEGDPLVLQVNIRPQDIDKVHGGEEARIRVMAGNARTTPELTGKVVEVSADVVTDDRTAKSWYVARVAPDAAGLAAFTDFALVPGMPAEAFIDQGKRTAFDYLLRPIEEQLSRAFKEY